MFMDVVPKTRLPASVATCFLICATLVVYFTNVQYVYVSDQSPAPWRPFSCDYVGFEIPTTGNGLGNHLFYYSVVVYIAWLTGRRPCMWRTKPHRILDEVFVFDIPNVDVKTVGCPLYRFKQEGVGVYDPRVKSLVDIAFNESIVVKGPFQSWKYAEPVADKIRQKLTFHIELTRFVAEFFAATVPAGWNATSFVRVGVHVRRGDFLSPSLIVKGFTTASERYFQRAMNYFIARFPRVQFFVASNDIPWCKKHIISSTFSDTKNVNITFSVGHSAGQDLALLASCNHTIMSTGTFSWWAAWLANGITVYYANYPRNGTRLSTQFRKDEYYHPRWMGIDD